MRRWWAAAVGAVRPPSSRNSWNNGSSKTAQVVDVTGRVIINTTTSDDVLNINMGNFSNGVYYVKLISDNATEVVKIIKQ